MSHSLTQRSLRTADAVAVTGILAAMELAEPVDEAYGVQDIVEEMTAPGVDLARAGVGILDDHRPGGVRLAGDQPARAGMEGLPMGGGAP